MISSIVTSFLLFMRKYLFFRKKVEILKDINFTLEKGQTLVLTGDAGSGKSSLLHILNNPDIPHTGEVLVYGKKGLGGEDKDLSNIEKAVQDYVSRELDCQHLLDAMIEKLRVCYEDEYQRNGFASEADYLSWRYG